MRFRVRGRRKAELLLTALFSFQGADLKTVQGIGLEESRCQQR